MDFTQWHADARLVKTYYDKSASTIDWLEDMGIEFSDVTPHNPGYYLTWHIVKSPDYRQINIDKNSTNTLVQQRDDNRPGVYLMGVLDQQARKLGVQIYLETPVKKILKNENRIVGVVAQDKSGDEITVKAKAVIVATGGFGGSFPPMLPGLTGDGIRMAREVGADTNDTSVGYAGLRPPRIPVGVVFQQPALSVNLLGQRFMNEEIMITNVFWQNAVARQKGGAFFTIFDEDTKNYYSKTGLDLVPHSLQPVAKFANFDSEFEKLINEDNNNFVMADTIENLANKTGINYVGLQKTLKEYNEFCDKGYDPIFNKKCKYLRPVRKPKFYSWKRVGRPHGTWEGIKINYKTEVLSKDFEVIPGLYAAGTDAMCNIYRDIYPYNLPGNALGFCLNSGRMAAESALEYLKSIQ
jgi:fumarate reductase flavoprotein subunit